MSCDKHPWTLQRSDGTCPSCEMDARIEDIRAPEARTEDEKRSRRQYSVGARIDGEHTAKAKSRSDKTAPDRARAIELLKGDLSPGDVSEAIGRPRHWVSLTARRHPDLSRAILENKRRRLKRKGTMLRAEGSFRKGENAARKRARERREKAIVMLRAGASTLEVSLALGVNRKWCYEQAARHPDLARAVRRVP